MIGELPSVYLARHGETEWSLAGKHTGVTDLPLTAQGERNAMLLGNRLRGLTFAAVFSSPLRRALQTCELAGYREHATILPDLAEWNYGDYEGRRTADIRKTRPDWNLYRDGCPNGESLEDVAARAQRVIALLRGIHGDVLVWAHRHLLTVLSALWADLAPADARALWLSTASLSILGYGHTLTEPVIRLWNDDRHLSAPE